MRSVMRACDTNGRCSVLHSMRVRLAFIAITVTVPAYDAVLIRNWMPTLTIRNVDPALKEELRVRAARHGRSMEAELRHILKEALGGGATPICTMVA